MSTTKRRWFKFWLFLWLLSWPLSLATGFIAGKLWTPGATSTGVLDLEQPAFADVLNAVSLFLGFYLYIGWLPAVIAYSRLQKT